MPVMAQNCGGPNHQEAANISIALPRYSTEALLAATRILLWHKSKPCGEFAAAAKMRWIEHCRGNRGCDDRTDTGNRRQSATDRIGSMPSLNFFLELQNLRLNLFELVD